MESGEVEIACLSFLNQPCAVSFTRLESRQPSRLQAMVLICSAVESSSRYLNSFRHIVLLFREMFSLRAPTTLIIIHH